MNISKNTVVQLHYSLFDEDGTLIEKTEADQPVAYLHGHKNMLESFEKELNGKAAGEQVSFTLTPEQAYGSRKEDAVARVPVKHLQGAKKWKKGMTAFVQTDQGTQQVVITKMGRFMANIDINHPLADKTIRFDVNIISVRQADPEEISHGHAHGAGGHQH